jgi:aspartate kinase
MKKCVKFGGSSLASAEMFRKVSDIIKSDTGRRFIVPSAPGKRFDDDIKITDMLYKCNELACSDLDFSNEWSQIKDRYDNIITDLGLEISLEDEYEEIEKNIKSKIEKDYAASRGEYLNGIILADFLNAEFIDAAEVIKFCDDGNINSDLTTELLRKRLQSVEKAVIPGFYGSDSNGKIVTFSRGGSDVTGSIVAAAIKATVYENWTDVSGFLVADPRIVENPDVIETITYKELRELSYMGATVLHENAIFPVKSAAIPINIRNTNDPTSAGTMIIADSEGTDSKRTITGIAGKKGFVNILIEKAMMNNELGFCRKVLEVFEKNGVSIEHTPSGIDTMSVIVAESAVEGKENKIISEIRKAVNPDDVEIEHNIALIAIVGRGMRRTRGTAARIFSALSESHINIKMIDQGSSELNIIVGIDSLDFEDAIRSIYYRLRILKKRLDEGK